MFDEDVVGGDAGLTGIGEFSEDDAVGNGIDIFWLDIEDDARGFSAQFEDVGDEIFGTGLSDGFTCVRAACEEDEVDVVLEEFLGDIGIAFDDDDGVCIEVTEDETRDEGARFGGVFAGFDDGGIAGGDGGDEWREGELDGVVPGADDEGDAAGLGACGAELREQEEGRPVRGEAHPGAEVVKGVLSLVQDEAYFCDPGFVCGFAKVFVEGQLEGFAFGLEHSDEGFELSFSPLVGERDVCIEVFADMFDGLEHG